MPKQKSPVNIKSRLNLKLDRALKDWVMGYAAETGTTVSNLIRDYFIRLQKHETKHSEGVEQI